LLGSVDLYRGARAKLFEDAGKQSLSRQLGSISPATNIEICSSIFNKVRDRSDLLYGFVNIYWTSSLMLRGKNILSIENSIVGSTGALEY